jgi:hypothetical protein
MRIVKRLGENTELSTIDRDSTLLQFGCIVLHPAVDRRVIDMQSPLAHHLLQISVTERIAEIPADTQ